jgi:hypothetical protein
MFKCAGSRERASAVEDKKKKGILSFRSSQIMLGLGFVRVCTFSPKEPYVGMATGTNPLGFAVPNPYP